MAKNRENWPEVSKNVELGRGSQTCPIGLEIRSISEAKHAIRPMYMGVGHPRQEVRCGGNADPAREWSGLRGSNPSNWLGKPGHYHYAKPAQCDDPIRLKVQGSRLKAQGLRLKA